MLHRDLMASKVALVQNCERQVNGFFLKEANKSVALEASLLVSVQFDLGFSCFDIFFYDTAF